MDLQNKQRGTLILLAKEKKLLVADKKKKNYLQNLSSAVLDFKY